MLVIYYVNDNKLGFKVSSIDEMHSLLCKFNLNNKCQNRSKQRFKYCITMKMELLY